MKALIAIFLTTCWLISASAPAFGEVLFLPMVSNQTNPGVGDPAADFKLENTRLWSWQENGAADALACGSQHVLHVHVFDSQGDTGQGSRLDGVIVQVTQVDQLGRRIVEYRATGMAGIEHGVAEFALTDHAEVRVFTAADGHPVSSQVAWVSTQPALIPVTQLTGSGYCSDDVTCAAMVAANRCAGAMSWNVVFKRNK